MKKISRPPDIAPLLSKLMGHHGEGKELTREAAKILSYQQAAIILSANRINSHVDTIEELIKVIKVMSAASRAWREYFHAMRDKIGDVEELIDAQELNDQQIKKVDSLLEEIEDSVKKW